MYDIIGDIHGFATPLKNLLHKLGYRKTNHVYTHPEGRQAVFVGDFIDRGPHIRETLQIVKAMCDAGSAQAVMGNHEYNAVCFHMINPLNGKPFRPHTPEKVRQHIHTLDQFQSYDDEWQHYLQWFRTLPMYLEFPHFNVVHAYWQQQHIDWIKQNYNSMDVDFLIRSCDNALHEYAVVEDTLKGVEVAAPGGVGIADKDGHIRDTCRVKWWLPIEQRYTHRDLYIQCPDKYAPQLLTDPLPSILYPHAKPAFFGHYSINSELLIENEMAICLDYNVTRGGGLIACRVNEVGDGIEKEIVVGDVSEPG